MKKLHDFDEVFDSQRAFRLILEAMANPTRKVSLQSCARKFHAGVAPFLAIGMTLLDNAVSFCVHNDEALANDLVSLTLAERATPESADFLFVPDASAVEALIPAAKRGTLRDPHLSATVIVLDNGTPSHPVRLYGPGIDGVAEVALTDAALAALATRDRQAYEYPQGIDLIFVTGEGELYAIPRLTLREVS
ncbi:MAG TPA: phosphonate C-P lyase system protein PhnH [Candidatus Limiplasma sp.]|nr:phosphonate C-P lyase system protein PhnH [Candidatus Limiplasma sp.]HPS81380.1 phosphonate C-P lyase system protein PhnH [Candidatus Limiplasma sp.]